MPRVPPCQAQDVLALSRWSVQKMMAGHISIDDGGHGTAQIPQFEILSKANDAFVGSRRLVQRTLNPPELSARIALHASQLQRKAATLRTGCDTLAAEYLHKKAALSSLTFELSSLQEGGQATEAPCNLCVV